MSTSTRPATAADALHVAAIVDIAGHGIDLELWLRSRDHDHSVIAAARRMVLSDTSHAYHYSKAQLIEVDGTVAGGLVGELLTEEGGSGESRDYIVPLLQLETRIRGHWSILAVAVYPEFRGRGLAAQLIEDARRRAIAAGALGLSIVVENSNDGALGLYKRLGFAEAESLPWIAYDGRSGPDRWIMLTQPF